MKFSAGKNNHDRRMDLLHILVHTYTMDDDDKMRIQQPKIINCGPRQLLIQTPLNQT